MHEFKRYFKPDLFFEQIGLILQSDHKIEYDTYNDSMDITSNLTICGNKGSMIFGGTLFERTDTPVMVSVIVVSYDENNKLRLPFCLNNKLILEYVNEIQPYVRLLKLIHEIDKNKDVSTEIPMNERYQFDIHFDVSFENDDNFKIKLSDFTCIVDICPNKYNRFKEFNTIRDLKSYVINYFKEKEILLDIENEDNEDDIRSLLELQKYTY